METEVVRPPPEVFSLSKDEATVKGYTEKEAGRLYLRNGQGWALPAQL